MSGLSSEMVRIYAVIIIYRIEKSKGYFPRRRIRDPVTRRTAERDAPRGPL